MWAVVDNNVVVGVITPDKTYEFAVKEANGKMLVEMTIENSPGYINGTYENGKFYPPKELING